MFHHREAFFFPAQEMYKLPSGEAYLAAKTAAILRRAPQYQTKNVKDKWAFLIAQFAESLPVFAESDRPNQLTTEEIKSRLNAFKDKRNSTAVSLYNLSLEQCNNYFEDFLFLYTTEDPRFKLSNAAKKTLLSSIIRAMGVCETGINTEFYAALQEVQRDTDWVRSELSKARSECVRDLHKRYNTQNNITNSMNVHVYDHFVKMANKCQLGIEQKETILDIHAWLLSSKTLDDCFNSHYKQVFQKYEQDAPQTLTTYVTSEINSVLGSDRWQNNPALSIEDIAALGQVLRMHFGEVRVDLFVREDYTEFEKDESGNFLLDEDNERIPILSSFASCLKSREEFDNAIRELVFQKMVTDGYYVSMERLIGNPDLRRGVKLRNNLSWDDLLAACTIIRNNQFDLLRNNTQHLNVIQAYPELILSHMRNCPELVSLLPNTQLALNQQIITIFSDMLQQEVDGAQNVERLQLLTSQLTDFFEGEPEYLQQLPDRLLNHREIGKALVAKDGLLWSILSPTLQQDQEVYQIAQEQNPDVLYYTSEQARNAKCGELLSCIPDQIRVAMYFPDPVAMSAQTLDIQIRHLVCLEAYNVLLNLDEISVADFLKHAPKIRPGMLKTVIEYRKEHGLKPLPIVGQSSSTLATLASFDQEICTQLEWDVFNNNPFKVRKLAEVARINQADNHHPLVYLAKNKNWIQGFSQYQAYQRGEGRRTLGFKALLLALGKAILWVLAIGLFVKAFIFVFPVVSFFAQEYGWSLILAWLALTAVNRLLRSRALGTITHIILHLAMLDWTFIKIGMIAMVSLLWQVCKHLKFALTYAAQGVSAFIQSKFHEPASNQNYLEQSDAVIARLVLLDEPASNQKANILKQLKTNMSNEPDAMHHPELVNKRYAITYQQNVYQISFAEVAACRREVDGEFSLEKGFGITMFGLFHMPTSSERVLADFMQDAQNEGVPVMR